MSYKDSLVYDILSSSKKIVCSPWYENKQDRNALI